MAQLSGMFIYPVVHVECTVLCMRCKFLRVMCAFNMKKQFCLKGKCFHAHMMDKVC